jgi:hypothetical protein
MWETVLDMLPNQHEAHLRVAHFFQGLILHDCENLERPSRAIQRHGIPSIVHNFARPRKLEVKPRLLWTVEVWLRATRSDVVTELRRSASVS